MGTDKALIEVDGVSLLARMVGILGRIFARVHLSIDPARTYPAIPASRIPDERAGAGPLEGVRAALAHLGAPALFAAVDLPAVSAELAAALWEAGTFPGRRGAVPRWEGGIEPAFAVYGPGLLPEVEALLAGRDGRFRDLAGLSGVTVIDLADPPTRARIFAGAAPDPADLFRNLNTPEDLGTWRRDVRLT
jgi:molybdopterin-guanine dinucleotide biosynthesis protein A